MCLFRAWEQLNWMIGAQGKKMWAARVSTIGSRQAVMFPYTLSYLKFSVFQKFDTSELLHPIDENIVLGSIHIR